MSRFFGETEEDYISLEEANILLQSVPYDGTSTWGKGADKGFEVFLNTVPNLEFYDIETDSEVYKKGIHILPDINEHASPEKVYQTVLEKTKELLNLNKFLTFFGGEHSISIGIIEAYRQKYNNLTVLQLDAHSDLRPSYHHSEYNHACALHKASKTTNLVQVGIRSMDAVEKPFLDKTKCFFAEDIYGTEEWMDKSIDLMTDDVYLTIDLDALDPSIMPSTGTPEPGGLGWDTTIRYLKKVFQRKNVVGFDIVEFAPIDGLHAPDFLVAKLYYKLLSYKFCTKK
ncbi:agmatinase [Carboxylicivirga sp. A043]|uniref:agmatinase n=1 Tax=Carboxylicivirga litoralis TaxID=2816963 RepID=UPI0021CB8DE3|nr:agmatinase [Carboxylicivirga sp. A043]MCU4156734.1 agmatinase [Carboxylicivirga sp. A043]